MANLSAITFLLVYAIFVCPFLSGGYAGCNDAARVACGQLIQLSGDQPLFIPIGYHTKYTHKTSSPPLTTQNQFPRKHVRFKQPNLLQPPSAMPSTILVDLSPVVAASAKSGVLPTSGQSPVTTAFERTMLIVLKSEVEMRPSQDSRRASLERSKSAFIASEGESDLDARKEWLLHDSLKGNFGWSKLMQICKSSDGNGSNRPTPLSSSDRPKPLSSRSDGNNKSSPGRSSNETSEKSLPLEKSSGSKNDSNGFDKDDDNEDTVVAKKRSHRDGSRRHPCPAEKDGKQKYVRRAMMERVTRAASSGMKLVRNSDLNKSSRPSNDDEDDDMAKESRMRGGSRCLCPAEK
jgi:hypothetical protein